MVPQLLKNSPVTVIFLTHFCLTQIIRFCGPKIELIEPFIDFENTGLIYLQSYVFCVCSRRQGYLVPSCTGSPEQWLARCREEEKYGKQKERRKNVKIKI
jgi:hypothetical protein